MLSCIGYSVGLGNLWRFPYLCLNNGGGAFLVPYLLYLGICGMSLFFMETAIGQSTGLSTIRIFNMIPFFKGLGWCMVFASAIVSIYYNLIIAYTLYYLGMSFNWVLPWSNCDNSWNTDQCLTDQTTRNASNTFDAFVYPKETSISNLTRRSSAEEFWLFNVLELSPDIETLGGIQWKLFGALVGSWVITFACMCRGIRSAGKNVIKSQAAKICGRNFAVFQLRITNFSGIISNSEINENLSSMFWHPITIR
ncbi:unnamed protein product [Dicrocoelium dendriticum]|nr:unnamed protein product [Dicrocoelium dendriticum]